MTKNGVNLVIMEDVFKFKNLTYNFRNAETLNRSNVNSVQGDSLSPFNVCFSINSFKFDFKKGEGSI